MQQLSPYFRSLARTPRICPSCREHKLKLNPTSKNPNAAVWKCDGCGWFQTVLAPERAEVGGAPGKKGARIIAVDFKR